MTRLSIQSRTENNSISIHLRPGQSCTIGSGGAADFCVADSAILSLHCRLVCQNSGGYIECLHPDSTIAVNQSVKHRSRLVNGDTLQIGGVRLDVEIPQPTTYSPDFHVNFEDEELDSTLGDEIDSFGEESSELDGSSVDEETNGSRPNFSEEESDTTLISDAPDDFAIENAESKKPLFEFDSPESVDDPFDDLGSIDAAFEEDSKLADFDDEPAMGNLSSQESEAPQSRKPAVKQNDDNHPQPQFSFGSTDSDNVELSEKDLQEVYDDDAESVFPTMNLSMAEELSPDSESVSVSLDHDVDLSLLDAPFEQQGDVAQGTLPAGINTDKFWRWSGTELHPALLELLQHKTRLNVFTCRGVQTQSHPSAVIKTKQYLEMENSIFLLTDLSIQKLQDVIRTQRWDDRMGTPLAIKMFLVYAPSSLIELFFSYIDSVLLVEDSEVSLLRLNRELN